MQSFQSFILNIIQYFLILKIYTYTSVFGHFTTTPTIFSNTIALGIFILRVLKYNIPKIREVLKFLIYPTEAHTIPILNTTFLDTFTISFASYVLLYLYLVIQDIYDIIHNRI